MHPERDAPGVDRVVERFELLGVERCAVDVREYLYPRHSEVVDTPLELVEILSG